VQVCLHASVCMHTAAFEPQAEPINKDCSEMRHESSSALTAELKDSLSLFISFISSLTLVTVLSAGANVNRVYSLW